MFWLFFFVMTIQSATVVESIAPDQGQVVAGDPDDLTIIAHVSRSGILELACDVGYHQEGVKCVPDEDVPYGKGCFADRQCIENLFCPKDKCRCKDYQHFSQETNRCEEDVDVPYGEPCLEDRQCNNTLLCIRDKCSCQSYDYYSNQTKTCKERTYTAPCTTSSHCRTNLICAGNKCVCYSEQFFNHSDETCKPRLGPNEGPCSSSDQCTSSLVCDDSTKKCVCELYQQNSLCNTTLQCSKSCSSISQCRSPSSCINNICTCPDGWYCDRTLIDCYPSLEHSKKCQSSVLNMCSGKDIRCVQDKTGQERCLCGNDMYRLYRSSTCRSIQELQVSPTLPAQRLTDKVTLTWLENNLGLPVTYKVQWESVRHSQDKGETTGSRSGVTVSGLTPGREYKFTFVSTLAEDQYYSQKTVEFADTLFTLAAKPGLINVTKSELENPPYVLKFDPPKGDVAKYQFTLTDGSLSQTLEVNSPQVEFSSLKPDTIYEYTVIAINKNGDQSEPVTGKIHIGEKTQAQSNDDNMMIIIIASSGSAAVVIIAVIVGLIIFVVHKKRRAQSQREDKDPSDETPYINPDGSIYDYIHENDDDSSYGCVKHNRDSTKSDPYTNPDTSEDEGMGSGGTFSTSMDTHTDNEGSLGYVTVRDSLPDEQLKPGWPADKSLNTDMKREEAMMNDYIDVIEEDAGKKENE